MSPRRSSRARTTQPSTSLPSQTISSSSSTSSGRADRSTRSHHKNQSPQKSTPPRSRSSEEDDETSRVASSEPLQTRRRKREREDDEELDRDVSRSRVREVQGDEDEEEEEEEVTRCVCGNQEYPGPPVPVTEQSIEVEVDSKVNIKDEANLDSSMTTSDVPSDEYGGLFIQCDMCKVWQHGGCVGIWDQSTSPEEYFCEECRRDCHKIHTGMNGQRFSRYRPPLEASSPKPPRSTSQSKDRDSKAPSNNKSNRPSIGSSQTKRRSTMNSRDAAYDEEEQLRKAIEESEREGKTSVNLDTSSRRVKRGRSDSEEKDHESKRQRTASNSPSGHTRRTNSQIGDSDDDAPSNKNSVSSGSKGIRAAPRNHRGKEPRDREKEKEKERADAAGRRKGRAERRRGDESDPSDEFPLSRTASTKGITETASQLLDPPISSQPTPNTPPTNNIAPVTTTSNSHRKTGRPPARRGRVGRNQYTKDRDLHNDTITGENGVAASPNRSQSRDGPPLDDGPTTHAHINGNHHSHSNGQGPVLSNDGSKPSKPRYMHPQRTTMNEMKRRVAAILEFISRTQVEMAGEHTPPAGGSGSSIAAATATALRGIGEALPGYMMVNGNSSGSGGGREERDFGEMTSLEMMDTLTRKLVLWQKEFGKYGEK